MCTAEGRPSEIQTLLPDSDHSSQHTGGTTPERRQACSPDGLGVDCGGGVALRSSWGAADRNQNRGSNSAGLWSEDGTPGGGPVRRGSPYTGE